MSLKITGWMFILTGVILIVINHRLGPLFGEARSKLASRIILFIAFALLIVGSAMILKDSPYYG